MMAGAGRWKRAVRKSAFPTVLEMNGPRAGGEVAASAGGPAETDVCRGFLRSRAKKRIWKPVGFLQVTDLKGRQHAGRRCS